MDSYVPFLAIDSVSGVFLTSTVFLKEGVAGYPFDPMIDCYISNLRKLVMNASVAGSRELEQLLLRTPNLEFEFSHQTKWHDCGFAWSPASFLDTVQDVCASTLKDLPVVVYDSSQWPAGPEVTLTDMTRFEKLAALELDVDMPCGTQYEIHPYVEESSEPVSPKLVDMLPASFEEVKLRLNTFKKDHLKCISHLVKGLLDSCATKLPNLKKLSLFVCLEHNQTLPKKALKGLNAAKSCGFSILKSGSLVPLL